MIFDKQGSTTIITKKSVSLAIFLDRLLSAYPSIAEDHIIINLLDFEKISVNDLLLFLEISSKHRNQKKSFVIITDAINYDETPGELLVVPTLQEAHDIVAMEDIERDLGF